MNPLFVCKGISACGSYTTHELCGGNVVKYSWEEDLRECNKCRNGMWDCGGGCGGSYYVDGYKCTKCGKKSDTIKEDKDGLEERIRLKEKKEEEERIRLKEKKERDRMDYEISCMMYEDARMNTYRSLRRQYNDKYTTKIANVGNWHCTSKKYKNIKNNTFNEIWNTNKSYLLWMVNNNKFKNNKVINWIEMKKREEKLIYNFPKYPIYLY